jgi:hypothetical protein
VITLQAPGVNNQGQYQSGNDKLSQPAGRSGAGGGARMRAMTARPAARPAA